ncbi:MULTISPECIES: alpha/beta hydrolase [unclassified Cupriavidus]|uniref:PHA/PHB synthase family protein n=1 Tax=unclassified Cupriavidus TaxID=2640874 RepID=UPI001404562A|nr:MULTISPECIES: alpha/beta fold hydrolase [unclassified Cupriavidus]MBF6988943.1 polyhydroxyalkanoic acid synthase [Cupriavidus sp. IK-TO18]
MKNAQAVGRTGPELSRPQGSDSRPAALNSLATHLDEPGGFELFRAIDRVAAAMAANATGGISPTALWLAYSDWLVHLSRSPGKQAELVNKAWKKLGRLAAYAVRRALTENKTSNCIEPLPGDTRFRAEAWQELPFVLWYQAFLLTQQWWHTATHDVPGVSPHHENVVSFSTRQVLDVFSPSNCIFTNPEVINRSLQTGGRSFVDGIQCFIEDLSRNLNSEPPAGTENFRVGEDVAITPGKVVYRNHLIELIQYTPSTESVYAEPLLIVPAWIMKFYILDLSPENSLIRYLVGKGFTVFCISWRNVTAVDRNLGLDDYRRLGVMAALGAIGPIVPKSKIHAIGYCLGGTLLSIAAAAMAHVEDERLASVTLLAAQTDFSEPGELELFIDHSQVESLEGLMWQRGYLPAFHMAGAFQLLRSNDLIWSRMLRHYLMGEPPPMNALIAWNADATRLPYRMHSEYLRSLFLNGDLAAGRYVVDEHPVAIQNIRAPIFAVGTEWDHIAPWPSVYKIHYLSDTDVTFVLTSGGHNAGIVSEPGHPGRRYWLAHKKAEDPCLHADRWLERAELREGSWWPAWVEWLEARSSRQRVPPPAMGAPGRGLPILADAPGTYVHQR